MEGERGLFQAKEHHKRSKHVQKRKWNYESGTDIHAAHLYTDR